MSEWISVRERLPEIGLPVLVCHRRKKVEPGERVAGAYTREVTHWMHMPQPPKGE